MMRFMVFLTLLVVATGAFGQVRVNGRVVDVSDSEPVAGASVIVRGADGKIKKFASSDATGVFDLSVATVNGCCLEVRMIGYENQCLALDSVASPLTIRLSPGILQLKEVAVKADRIREQGDTVTYVVGSFAQQQDRTIGDVLRRMPGINVEQSGKIQYQGIDINKFYIEGADLLGGKYGIATNGISYEDVGAVEVMENHQPMQVLTGIAFSDNAAINLKLKDKAKAVWTGHGHLACGGTASSGQDSRSWQPSYLTDLFAMAIKPRFQNITTLKSNNVGEDLAPQTSDFFGSSRNTALAHNVDVSLPSVPGLGANRTIFNRSALLSTNSLCKAGSGEVKMQLDYGYNRFTNTASNITTYFLEESRQTVTETRRGADRSHSLSARFAYELNQKTVFINNTLKTNLDWDDISVESAGSIANRQSVTSPDYFVGNDLNIIKRFGGKHLVTFKNVNEWESLPQTLSVDKENETLCQSISNRAFYTQESAAYAFLLKGITVGVEAGIKGYLRRIETDGGLSTNFFALYATPKFEYACKRVNVSVSIPISFSRYTFDNSIRNRAEVYCTPSLNFNWKPNNRLNAGVGAGAARAPVNLSLIFPGYVMTDYRNFRRGLDDFYNTTSQRISAHLAYKLPPKGFFMSAGVVHSWSHLPYTAVQLLFGDCLVNSYAVADSDRKIFNANARVGKTLDFMRGSGNVSCSFTRVGSHLLSDNRLINSVNNHWSVAANINCSPLGWLSVDYKVRYSDNGLTINSSALSRLDGLVNELSVNVIPCDKCEWHVGGEHYRNEISNNIHKNVLLLDTKFIFKPARQIEISASITNLLNVRSYNYTLYSQVSSFESRRQLRGRELLISFSMKR